MSLLRRITRRKILCRIMATLLFSAILTAGLPAQPSWAAKSCTCGANLFTLLGKKFISIGGSCKKQDCTDAEDVLEEDHDDGEDDIIEFIGDSNGSGDSGGSGQFGKFEDWLEDFTKQNIIRAMMMMTEQLSAVAMQQVFAFGTMLDAKHQLETQRLFQTLQAEAHRDYQPSQDFCWFGTNARSLAHSEQRSHLNTQALNARQMERLLGTAPSPDKGVAGAFTRSEDRLARWEHFTKTYCDPQDNNFTDGKTGLVLACGGGGKRVNRDIDFTRLIEHPRTLDINFTNQQGTDDEQDVLALSSNLYGHNVLTRNLDESYMRYKEGQQLYIALRAVAAKRAVAESSFNAIVGMKSSGTTDVGAEGEQTRNFLGAVMAELGVPEGEIYELIGQNPSYYAQLEILAKKIYQNPDFYANLYDKPANVARKGVALRAIELMVDRALYESQLRYEMATSVLLAAKLRKPARDANMKLSGN